MQTGAARHTFTGVSLEDVRARLLGMPDEERAAALALAKMQFGDLAWVPNPGPQTVAFDSPADELFYGGQAGGGKTDLEIGLALTQHRNSLLLRRTNREAAGIVERIADILGTRDGWSGQAGVWRYQDRVLDVGGCQLEDDKQKYKGKPHDLICFDEVSDFSETQYAFIIGWNRSVDPGQRCRVVAAGNPPTTPEGLWVLKRWAAWLDPTHHNPAAPGELRWYTTGPDGKELEVDSRGPHVIQGEEVFARSRTFIPAALSNNPDLAATDYAAVLSALPEELRAAYRDGRFDLALRDNLRQVVPTSWVRAAQERWTTVAPHGVPMCAIGVDVAQGGQDSTVLAARYDGWFAPLIKVPGTQTPDGRSVAGLVISHRRDGAAVIIDMGGGYGGAALEHLRDNGVDVHGFKGAEASMGRTVDAQLKYVNKRAAAYWRFREALDPSQPGGSPIMLPRSPSLVADLTAPTFDIGPRGIIVEPKDKLVARLGRSPDDGDAVVMAWYDGPKLKQFAGGQIVAGTGRRYGATPKVVMRKPR